MKINNIKLSNFRNYKSFYIDFDSGRNIIIGENAQGKTNLIEAIYLCAFARSFRTSNAAEMVNFEKDLCSIEAEIESEDFRHKISIKINKKGKKMIKKDGKLLKRTAELLNNFVVIIFSPEDLRIIKDNPEKRRNFIDKEISQLRPMYFEHLRHYQNVLDQKKALLRQIKNQSINESDGFSILNIYDEQLSNYGIKVIDFRRRFIALLSQKAEKIQNEISGNKEKLEIYYKESVSTENFRKKIKESRKKDIELGHCLYGPHRDDLIFYINGKNVKKYGSQGQQRTVALVLKLAEIQIAKSILGENAVLLLDDVLSELDKERKKYLFNKIKDIQIFMTTTEVEKNLLENMNSGKVFCVKNGILLNNDSYEIK